MFTDTFVNTLRLDGWTYPPTLEDGGGSSTVWASSP